MLIRSIFPLGRRLTRFVKHLSSLSAPTHVNVGTLGHVDHGKTSLSSALTKVSGSKFVHYDEIDSGREEKARGVTIRASHIEYFYRGRHYCHTDCPGHRDYIKNMISGTSGMDGAILVVAATDGQMPQTREHLLLAKQIGVERVVVFINKCDLVDEDVISLVELEVRELLTDFGFDGDKTPFVAGSAVKALKGDNSPIGEPSIKQLLDAMHDYIPIPTRDVTSPFLVPVDSCFTIQGRGTVVVGTVKRGVVAKNSEADLLGFDQCLRTTVSDVQVFKKSVPSASAGDNIGALLRGIRIQSVRQGMILSLVDSLQLSNCYFAQVYFLGRSEGGRSRPITPGYIQQLFSATWNIACRVDFESEMAMPGEHIKIRLTLMKKMVMTPGQTFTIRENHMTVATGIITEILGSIEIVNSKLSKIKL